MEPLTARCHTNIETPKAEMTSLMSDAKRLKLKFDQRSTSVVTRPREDILAIPKQEYQGQDFF